MEMNAQSAEELEQLQQLLERTNQQLASVNDRLTPLLIQRTDLMNRAKALAIAIGTPRHSP